MILRMFLILTALFMAIPVPVPASAQTAEQAPVATAPVIPSFVDPNFRLTRPDLSGRTRLRFLTVTDFPPFSFIDARKRLTGFHVDLAREVCRTLALLDSCQIQAVPLAELEAELLSGNAEAALAGLRPTRQRRETLDFSHAYFRLPGRFAVPASSELAGWVDGAVPFIEQLDGREIGIIDGTAHAAFAKAWFGTARLRLFADQTAALEALRANTVAALFGDAVNLSFSMQEPGPRALAFAGPPYFSADYFGTGLTAAVARDDDELRDGIDYALATIFRDGRFAELYLRYFPVGIF